MGLLQYLHVSGHVLAADNLVRQGDLLQMQTEPRDLHLPGVSGTVQPGHQASGRPQRSSSPLQRRFAKTKDRYENDDF